VHVCLRLLSACCPHVRVFVCLHGQTQISVPVRICVKIETVFMSQQHLCFATICASWPSPYAMGLDREA
jgi:hypothetical protein